MSAGNSLSAAVVQACERTLERNRLGGPPDSFETVTRVRGSRSVSLFPLRVSHTIMELSVFVFLCRRVSYSQEMRQARPRWTEYIVPIGVPAVLLLLAVLCAAEVIKL